MDEKQIENLASFAEQSGDQGYKTAVAALRECNNALKALALKAADERKRSTDARREHEEIRDKLQRDLDEANAGRVRAGRAASEANAIAAKSRFDLNASVRDALTERGVDVDELFTVRAETFLDVVRLALQIETEKQPNRMDHRKDHVVRSNVIHAAEHALAWAAIEVAKLFPSDDYSANWPPENVTCIGCAATARAEKLQCHNGVVLALPGGWVAGRNGGAGHGKLLPFCSKDCASRTFPNGTTANRGY